MHKRTVLAESSSNGTSLVMVLEENTVRRNFIASELRNENFLVVTESNGEQAIKAIEQDRPKVLIMSIFLNSYDVVQFIVRVRSQFSQLPIICTYDGNSNKKDISLQSSLLKKLGIASVIDVSNLNARLLVHSVVESLTSHGVDFSHLGKALAD